MMIMMVMMIVIIKMIWWSRGHLIVITIMIIHADADDFVKNASVNNNEV